MFDTEARTILVDDHRAEGFARSADSSTDARGRWGQVVDEVRDFTADQPFLALLSAAGLGAVVGFLTTRR